MEVEEVEEEEVEPVYFSHEGEDLYKISQSDGTFQVIIADKDSVEGDEFFEWGHITKGGDIVKTMED